MAPPDSYFSDDESRPFVALIIQWKKEKHTAIRQQLKNCPFVSQGCTDTSQSPDRPLTWTARGAGRGMCHVKEKRTPRIRFVCDYRTNGFGNC
ncbi:hypothetical protein EVAR_66533_1 [Eumeta japonica]|uniref:Uncharacterized protein n=1 Tax=Eumeta variegata TaxID=151549 RepID=A0A4C1ZAE0_EUMVA|nr:hypothetical protein EVAR_66533_1 [Eumeta japonica]